MTATLRRMCRKKQRLYNKAKRSKRHRDWMGFEAHKKATVRAMRRAHWEYVENILTDSLAENNKKPFWRYVKAQRQDNFGVAPLREGTSMYTGSKDKSEVLNRQFSSVFTVDGESGDANMTGPGFPPINKLQIAEPGIRKLLQGINVNKASGPDGISCRILHELASELAPVLTALYNQSLASGKLPEDWLQAHVCPIFKKGSQHDAANYRPVSLTCVACKILEHVVCKHILDHLDHHHILTDVQHGFRRHHSCETQLLITMHDLQQYRNERVQVDMAVLDYAKAFDTVPHKRLMNKLAHYGIGGELHTWIYSFLSQRTQRVRVDGELSSEAQVLSGVPQGTVLGLLLFLLFIKDLPSLVSSQVRLFTDDCLLYRPIHSEMDQVTFQQDLHKLGDWCDM